MPQLSIITTAREVFFGGDNLDSISFKNGSAAGIIYLRNRQQRSNTVTSTDYEWSLSAGQAVGVTKANDGAGVIGPWEAISDTVGGVTLEILPIYQPGRGRR